MDENKYNATMNSPHHEVDTERIDAMLKACDAIDPLNPQTILDAGRRLNAVEHAEHEADKLRAARDGLLEGAIRASSHSGFCPAYFGVRTIFKCLRPDEFRLMLCLGDLGKLAPCTKCRETWLRGLAEVK